MPIADWPDDLPNVILLDGFTPSQADGRLRQQGDTGPAGYRLLSSAAVMPVPAQIFCEGPNQLARFDRFWNEQIGRGAKPFFIRDQIFDGLKRSNQAGAVRIDDAGNHMIIRAWWLAQIKGAPSKPSKVGLRFHIAFELEVLP